MSINKNRELIVELATDHSDVVASQALRFRVFGEEMGAMLETGAELLDRDYYDSRCHHMLVRNSASGEVVASTRILTDTQARLAGSYYSESEFDLQGLLPLPGRVMEIGRTCVHPEYRNGAAISVLWGGLAQFMSIHGFDYLIGCASISLKDGGAAAHAICRELREKHLTSANRRVQPRHPLPGGDSHQDIRAMMPPLLKAYLRLGARICGEPCLDEAFNVADVFVLLDMDDLHPRYQRHFVDRARSQGVTELPRVVAANQ